MNEAAEANPASPHMFIVNPLSGLRMDGLFSTHPATENRIAALEELAAQMGAGGVAQPSPPPRQPGPWSGGGRRNPWG